MIEAVPVTVWCSSCTRETRLADNFEMICPACGNSKTELRSGRELQITGLEVQDEGDGDTAAG
jgi:hydrogenase nickel incorporation protein HypA/HybF